MATVTYTCYIFLMAFTFRAVVADYCKQRDCGKQHTMCKFPNPIPAQQCNQHPFSGLTTKERNIILTMHNLMRQKVGSGQETKGAPGPQPASSNLGLLKWDNELATIAQRWAIQCVVDHDQCRHVDRFHVGQNVGHIKTFGPPSRLNVETIVRSWYNEVRFFNKNQVDAVTIFKTSKGEWISHYIQMVWAETKRVGCGAIRYSNSLENHMLLVCNYGPSGNRVGQPVYKRIENQRFTPNRNI